MATSRGLASRQDHFGPELSHYNSDEHTDDGRHSPLLDADSVDVKVLEEHLINAKQALFNVNAVQCAEELSNSGRVLHEESLVLAARTVFLRNGMDDQLKVLQRLRHDMRQAYDDHLTALNKKTIPKMDDAGERLEWTRKKLKSIAVDPHFRPSGEAPMSLHDFVLPDVANVRKWFADLKDGIDLQQRNLFQYESDTLAHLDEEIEELTHAFSSVPAPPTHFSTEAGSESIIDLFDNMRHVCGEMAEALTQLTNHFDKCVVAVRSTNGGADLPVSTSGVLPEHDMDLHLSDKNLRDQWVTLVIEDAPMVDEAVQDILQGLEKVVVYFDTLKAQSDRIKADHVAVVQAYQLLEKISPKLKGYVQGANDFVRESDKQKEAMFAILSKMGHLQKRWDIYAGNYDTAILEAMRRRAVEEKIAETWNKAFQQVRKLQEEDRSKREAFMANVGNYMPADLWNGMSGPLPRWELVLVEGDADDASASGNAASWELRQREESAATLERGVEDGALERAGDSSGRRS